MLRFPCAKINIGLHVIRKREDGFHEIETVFYPVNLCDALEAVSLSESKKKSLEGKIIFNSSGLEIPGSLNENLIIKVFDLLDRSIGLPAVEVHLHKAIPAGAGLGGGSSDAAFFLVMMNRLFDLHLQKEELIKWASTFGSDCAFFLDPIPCIGRGRGEIIEKTHVSLKGKYCVIVKPTFSISTADAYRMVKPHEPECSVTKALKMPLDQWKHYIKNDFEQPLAGKFPEIMKLIDSLYREGAVYASLSGSGSAVFGIFDSTVDAAKLFQENFIWSGYLN